MKLNGSCLCKQVQYQITPDAEQPFAIIHCHCSTCRKTHASAFSSVCAVKDESFEITQGQNLLNSYQSSQGKHRYFCPNCGSHIYAKRDGTPHIILRLGTLDAEFKQYSQAKSHIWLSEKADWYELHQQLEEFQEFPK